MCEAIFSHDLAAGAKVSASNTRGGDAQFAAANVIDGNRQTYWATDDNASAPELVLDLGKTVAFNVVRLREYLPLGQRIEAFALDQWKDGQWAEFATGTSIGNCRLVHGEKVTTDMSTIVNLRQDPFERTPSIRQESVNELGGGYMNEFYAREFWRFVLVQQKVAELAQTAVHYPPMQAPASFNLEAVKRQIQETIRAHEGQ